MLVMLGTLAFSLGERIEIDGQHAEFIAALLAARDTRPGISAAEKIGYEMTVDPDQRADVKLAVAERAELLYVLEEINPNRTDLNFAALQNALGTPVTRGA